MRPRIATTPVAMRGHCLMVEILGVVSLVGAGPGDPGLITVKGLQRLREADVVAYDRLVDRRLLEEAREDAELIDVGKQAGQGGARQRSIYPILIDRAHEGKRVVRLKGGDPFVFGRGGEEAQVLAMAGIPFEVVPGVSSAVAAPAYAGIPLTHRDAATSFTVVSAVEDGEKRESAIPWGVLARTRGTLVVMMGWGALPRVVEKLLGEGMSPSMPAAVVQWGTEPYQKTVVGVLQNIVERAQDADFGPPVVVVIGRVVELRREIRWFEDKPLSGKRVLVTRSRPQASVLSRMLAEEGAEAIEVPTIEIAPPADFASLDEALRDIGGFGWMVFTSVNGGGGFLPPDERVGYGRPRLGWQPCMRHRADHRRRPGAARHPSRLHAPQVHYGAVGTGAVGAWGSGRPSVDATHKHCAGGRSPCVGGIRGAGVSARRLSHAEACRFGGEGQGPAGPW